GKIRGVAVFAIERTRSRSKPQPRRRLSAAQRADDAIQRRRTLRGRLSTAITRVTSRSPQSLRIESRAGIATDARRGRFPDGRLRVGLQNESAAQVFARDARHLVDITLASRV